MNKTPIKSANTETKNTTRRSPDMKQHNTRKNRCFIHQHDDRVASAIIVFFDDSIRRMRNIYEDTNFEFASILTKMLDITEDMAKGNPINGEIEKLNLLIDSQNRKVV